MAEVRQHPLEEILFGPTPGSKPEADLAEVFLAWYRAARARQAQTRPGRHTPSRSLPRDDQKQR